MHAESGREIGRIAASVLLVSAGTAAVLRSIDAVPSLLLGEPRGIVRYSSLDEAATALGRKALVPAYFPDSLRWPPSSVRVGRSPEPGLAIHFSGRDGREHLFIFETLPGGRIFPHALVPEARPFYAVPANVGPSTAVFRSVSAGPNGSFSEVEFHAADRRILVRFDGPGDELMKIAGSLREKR